MSQQTKAKASSKKNPGGMATWSSVDLSEREELLLEVLKVNEFTLNELLRVTLYYEELSRAVLPKGGLQVPKGLLVSQPKGQALESKDGAPSSTPEVSGPSGNTRRSNLKKARKEIRSLLDDPSMRKEDLEKAVISALRYYPSIGDNEQPQDYVLRFISESQTLKDMSDSQKGLLRDSLTSHVSGGVVAAVEAASEVKTPEPSSSPPLAVVTVDPVVTSLRPKAPDAVDKPSYFDFSAKGRRKKKQ